MFDVNPASHRHYLDDLERQVKPRLRTLRAAGKGGLFFRIRGGHGVFALALLLVGGIAGGTVL